MIRNANGITIPKAKHLGEDLQFSFLSFMKLGYVFCFQKRAPKSPKGYSGLDIAYRKVLDFVLWISLIVFVETSNVHNPFRYSRRVLYGFS